jgi:hypothetical protein
MKNILTIWMMASLVLMGCAQLTPSESRVEGPAPKVEVISPVKMSKKATVTIKGQGFKPGQEVNLLFTAKDGIQSDIGYALKPEPKADQSGSWSTTWKCGRFIKKKLVKAGKSYKITVTDIEYNPLAHTSVLFSK